MAGNLGMQDYASVGSAVLTGDSAYIRPIKGREAAARQEATAMAQLAGYVAPGDPRFQAPREAGQAMIGWEMPTQIFDRMKQINASALALNFDIEDHVAKANVSFRNSWDVWFAEWTTFMKKYQDSMLSRIASWMDSDRLAAQVESYATQLDNWKANYAQQTQDDGSPVPPTMSPDAPKVETEAEKNKKASGGLPWWVISLIVIGGVALAGGMYFVFHRKFLTGKEGERFARRAIIPITLGGAFGPAGAALGHASADAHYGPGRDPDAVQKAMHDQLKYDAFIENYRSRDPDFMVGQAPGYFVDVEE